MAGEAAPTTQRAVLEAVQERLIAQVEGLTESIVHITDSEDPPVGMAGYYWCTLWPLGGMFDESAFLGGGIHTIFENAGVAIAVFRKNKLDRAGETEEMLLGTDPVGLFDMKRRILKAFSGHRLSRNQEFILIEEMRPLRSDNPRVKPFESGRVADVYVEFNTFFHWDLTGGDLT